ncbi:DUF6049 family protein [Humibacter albus]|uniref:DUF6049 family protein n=1 Tax=Humibacter albus TaxID=427754 RepID=UPI0003B4B691|nr:DUF6049 family protein [Humibacter albus]
MRLIRGRRGASRSALLAACVAALLALVGAAPAQAAALGAAGSAAAGSAGPASGSSALASAAPSAHANAEVKADSDTVSLYAGDAGTTSPGAAVTVTVSLGNATPTPVDTGSVDIAITTGPLATRSALDAWTSPSGDHPATRVIATDLTPAVPPGTTERVASVTIPAKTVGLSGGSAVYGLKATITEASGAVGTGYSTLAYTGDTVQNKVGLAVAMPITVPPTAAGLISSDELAAYTGTDGLLTRQLALAEEHPAMAIGIDPMIIASIRVLGDSAPQSARSWLQDLADLTNDSFPLQYGDADVATELQSGFTSLLAPTSFAYALDERNFSSPLSVGETPSPTPTATTNPFVTPTPTATASSKLPTLESLLAWPYTFAGIAWPADDSLRGSDVEDLVGAGYPSTIVYGSNTNASTLGVTPNAPLSVKGGTALVADQGVSDALRRVVGATNADEENAALASVSAQLAEIDGQSDGNTIILAALDRDWPSGSSEANRGLTSVYNLPWAQVSSLRDALNAPHTDGLALKDVTQDADRTANVKTLTADAGSMDAFATVLSDPALLTGNTRNQLLTLLGVGWLQSENNWPAAVSSFTAKARQTTSSVNIDPTGKITVASAQSLIPVTVTNSFSMPVNVVLRATPSNGRLEVDSDTSKTIPAKASAKVLVPVKAKLGNGSVKLSLQLYSPTGLKVGTGQTAAVEVHADWEGLGALILGIAVVLFFGFGLTRSIVRRIRGRGKDASPSDSDAPDDIDTPVTRDDPDTAGAPDAGDDGVASPVPDTSDDGVASPVPAERSAERGVEAPAPPESPAHSDEGDQRG